MGGVCVFVCVGVGVGVCCVFDYLYLLDANIIV